MSNQKQKLAQMVLQKMKQKKQAEQKARPHYQVLRLNVTFSIQQNQHLKYKISNLTSTLKKQNQLLAQLKQNLQDLQNTGKKKYPVIIIKPQFIASQNISSSFKQFYRKTSNTFLKADMIKTQKHQTYLLKQQEIIQKLKQITQKQKQIKQQNQKNTKIMQQKRTKVLKQDIRRRQYIAEQKSIQNQINRLKQQNYPLIRQYEIKKQNLQNRIQYSENLSKNIQQEKRKIQQKYNPQSYREYLKKVFDVRIKNEHIQKSLLEIVNKLNYVQELSEKYKKTLQSKCSIIFIGKSSDSPSKFKGRIQKTLQKQKQKRSHTNPRQLTQMINLKTQRQKSQRFSKRSKSILNQQQFDNNHVRSLIRSKKGQINKHYSSLKTLKGAMQNTIKSDRTLSTAFALSSAKKRFIDF